MAIQLRRWRCFASYDSSSIIHHWRLLLLIHHRHIGVQLAFSLLQLQYSSNSLLEETKWLSIFLPNSQCLLAVPIPHFRLYCLVRQNTWFPGHLKSAKVLARSPNCYIFHRIWNVSVSANLIKHSHKRTTKTFVCFVWHAVDSPPSYNTGDASLACNVL